MDRAHKLLQEERILKSDPEQLPAADSRKSPPDPQKIMRLFQAQKGDPTPFAPAKPGRPDVEAVLDLVRRASEALMASDDRAKKLEAYTQELLAETFEKLEEADALVKASEAKVKAAEALAQAAEARAQAAEAQAKEVHEGFGRIHGAIIEQFASRLTP